MILYYRRYFYASAHPVDGARGIMFLPRLSVHAYIGMYVHNRVDTFFDQLAVDF